MTKIVNKLQKFSEYFIFSKFPIHLQQTKEPAMPQALCVTHLTLHVKWISFYSSTNLLHENYYRLPKLQLLLQFFGHHTSDGNNILNIQKTYTKIQRQDRFCLSVCDLSMHYINTKKFTIKCNVCKKKIKHFQVIQSFLSFFPSSLLDDLGTSGKKRI